MKRSLALVAGGLTVLCVGLGAAVQRPQDAVVPKDRPNLIVVVLDDARVDITESMPRLRSLMMEKGVRFSAAVANTPLCGPSRSILLAGQYAHNTKVYYNDGPNGGYTAWSAGNYDQKNVGPWLQTQGYRTGLFGKYMNGFPIGREDTFVPPGWDDFRGVMSDREARNNLFTLNENGVLKIYEASTGGYQTDLLTRRVEEFIRSTERNDDQPFFAYLALTAPHGPQEPAARHRNLFPGEKAPRVPSFDEADISDKPQRLREQAPRLSARQATEIDTTYREMRQALASVEDSLEELLKTLTETGEISKTYLFLTSDNGWLRGEHRIPSSKYAPYEESILVPLFVRGPGVPAGQTVSSVVGLVDLAPTLLELAGAPQARMSGLDGRSLARFLQPNARAKGPWRESMLIEHFGGGEPFRIRSYSGIRSEHEVYIEYASGETEYYDLRRDPYQMENTAGSLSPAARARLSARVAALKDCAGDSCRAADGAAVLPQR